MSVSDIKNESFWLMPQTPRYIQNGIPYITSKNIKNNIIDFDNLNYISKNDYLLMSKNRKIEINDILITMIGTIGEVAIVKDDIEFYGQNLYLLRLNQDIILNKYFYYFFTLPIVRNRLVEKKNASSQGYIKAGSIENLIINIPSIEEQKKVVSKLENLDRICNDLTSGLPAEIEARKKQYEYYRDKLLSFDI